MGRSVAFAVLALGLPGCGLVLDLDPRAHGRGGHALDGGAGDAGVFDGAARDARTRDGAALDASAFDAGRRDAGFVDATAIDATAIDAGLPDGAAWDAAPFDASLRRDGAVRADAAAADGAAPDAIVRSDAAAGDAGGCGVLGAACVRDSDCGTGAECDATGVCIPMGRPICGGFAGATCPPEYDSCPWCSGCDYGTCLFAAEATCICSLAPPGSYACTP